MGSRKASRQGGAAQAGRAPATRVQPGETNAGRALNEYVRRLPADNFEGGSSQRDFGRAYVNFLTSGAAGPWDNAQARAAGDLDQATMDRVMREIDSRTRNRQIAGARRRRQ